MQGEDDSRFLFTTREKNILLEKETRLRKKNTEVPVFCGFLSDQIILAPLSNTKNPDNCKQFLRITAIQCSYCIFNDAFVVLM